MRPKIFWDFEIQMDHPITARRPYLVLIEKKKKEDLLPSVFCHYLANTKFSAIGLMSKVFANGSGDWGSIPGQVIPKTQKMVLEAVLLNTQHYKVGIKGKV